MDLREGRVDAAFQISAGKEASWSDEWDGDENGFFWRIVIWAFWSVLFIEEF